MKILYGEYFFGLAIIGLTIAIIFRMFNHITPMDVYKGNTKLEYKGYYDGDTFIKTDSVVILINKKTK